MTEPSGLDERIFDGLELEEPSGAVDAAILAFARGRSPASAAGRRRAAARRALWLHGGLAAAIAIGLFLALPADRSRPAGGREPAGVAGEAPASADRVLAELRSDLDQIRQMSELIPEDSSDREEIAERLRVCLSDLESLELKLQAVEQSSIEGTERKEARI